MKNPQTSTSEKNRFFDDDELPDGWVLKSFMDVFDIEGGTQPPKSTFVYEPQPNYVRLLQIRDFGERPYPTYISDEKKLKKCVETDILVGRYGASVGRICTGLKGAYNVALTKVIIPNEVDRRFVFFLLQSNFFQEPILEIERSAQNGFNKGDLESIYLPIPPLAEQQRIVARVEVLLTNVNAAHDRLSRVPLIMKKFRQVVLAAACSGRLMDEPDGYESRSAGELFADARYGTSNKCDYIKEQKIPVLRIPNIATGKLELTDLKFGDLTDKEIQRLAVQEGDLIICRTNGSLDLVGKAATIPHLSEQFVFASYLIRVRVNRNLLLPDYYHICLTGQVGRDHIEEMARSTAGQFNLNLEILRTMPIPLPPLANQHEIVLRVGTLFERADAIDREVVAASRRCEQLTQAVLGKAFSGSL